MTCSKTLYVVSSLVRIFPDKPESEYGALKESIKRLGLLDPILMWRETVVDGYHRLRACLELGVEPRFDVLFADADPMEIVVDRMGPQRHLNETDRDATAVPAMGKPKPGHPTGSRKNRANLRGFRTRRWAARVPSLTGPFFFRLPFCPIGGVHEFGSCSEAAKLVVSKLKQERIGWKCCPNLLTIC